MFAQAFNLTALPFEEHISADKVLVDDRFTQALNRLDYFADYGLVALMTGPTGVGKSCLITRFLDALPAHRYQPLYLHISRVNSAAMLRMIVAALDEKPSLGKDRLFRQILDKTQGSERRAVIVIDDAHLLNEGTLTDLRILVSAPQGNQPSIKLLLCGQSSLSKLLARASLADLLNRICVRCHLPALTKDQTVCYIDQRLKAFGGSDALFEMEAKHLIHDHTGGIPRQINNLATTCLIHAASKNLKRINETLVVEAAAELRLL
jgi:general secretion pathway protein A